MATASAPNPHQIFGHAELAESSRASSTQPVSDHDGGEAVGASFQARQGHNAPADRTARAPRPAGQRRGARAHYSFIQSIESESKRRVLDPQLSMIAKTGPVSSAILHNADSESLRICINLLASILCEAKKNAKQAWNLADLSARYGVSRERVVSALRSIGVNGERGKRPRVPWEIVEVLDGLLAASEIPAMRKRSRNGQDAAQLSGDMAPLTTVAAVEA